MAQSIFLVCRKSKKRDMKTRLPPEVKSELLMLSNVVGKVSETLDYSNRYCLIKVGLHFMYH